MRLRLKVVPIFVAVLGFLSDLGAASSAVQCLDLAEPRPAIQRVTGDRIEAFLEKIAARPMDLRFIPWMVGPRGVPGLSYRVAHEQSRRALHEVGVSFETVKIGDVPHWALTYRSPEGVTESVLLRLDRSWRRSAGEWGQARRTKRLRAQVESRGVVRELIAHVYQSNLHPDWGWDTDSVRLSVRANFDSKNDPESFSD